MFAKDVETLLECFRQFPQFNGDLFDCTFIEDLHVRASSQGLGYCPHPCFNRPVGLGCILG